MKRINQLHRLDQLLKVCRTCDRKSEAYNKPNICEGCDIRTQILAIGNHLENMNRERKPVNEKLVLEIETYMKLKGQGKSDAEIAKQFGIKQPTLIYYKKKWEKEAVQAGKLAVKRAELAKANEPENKPKNETVKQELVIQALQDSQTPPQPVTAEEKKAPCSCLSKQEKAEYERLIAALRSDLTEAHKQLDERDEKIRNLEHLHAACEDCENEISSLQQANADMKKELLAVEKEKEELEPKYESTLSVIDRLNEHIKGLKLQIKPLEEENQAMRQLIKKWA